MSESMLFTGKRGNGKSLGALYVMERYLREGRTVATNLDIRLEHLAAVHSQVRAFRLPDHPTADDLRALGLGNPQPTQEKRNGLLVLDECSTFLNAREWQGKDRAGLLAWLVQSRKYGWDLLLIAQHPKQLDAQIRESLVELHGVARRLDKIRFPVLGGLWKLFTGRPLYLPRLHVVTLLYGFGQNAALSDRLMFRGALLYEAYDSLQKIDPVTGNQHLYSYLSPWHLKGRYLSKWAMVRKLMMGGVVAGLFVGALGGFVAGRYAVPKPVVSQAAVVAGPVAGVAVTGVIDDDGRQQVILSDGRIALAQGMQADAAGVRYQVAGQWYQLQK